MVDLDDKTIEELRAHVRTVREAAHKELDSKIESAVTEALGLHVHAEETEQPAQKPSEPEPERPRASEPFDKAAYGRAYRQARDLGGDALERFKATWREGKHKQAVDQVRQAWDKVHRQAA